MVATDLLPIVAEPRRREILRVLWNDELAAGDVHAAIGEITFGAVSQHLRRLRDAGVVQRRKEGRRRLYRVRRDRLGAIAEMLEAPTPKQCQGINPHDRAGI